MPEEESEIDLQVGELGGLGYEPGKDGEATVVLERILRQGVELRVKGTLYGRNVDGCVVGAEVISVNKDSTERDSEEF